MIKEKVYDMQDMQMMYNEDIQKYKALIEKFNPFFDN